MIIQTNQLPDYLLKKLPLSVRIQNTIDTDKLAPSLKLEIENYIKNTIFSNISDINSAVYDIIFDKGIYDIKHLTDIKEVVIQYIKNFLLTRKGTYPFDPEFGSNLYKYIQTKDLDYIGSMIALELSNIIDQISQLFDNVKINVEKLNIYQLNSSYDASYYIYIEISVNNEIGAIELTT